MRKSIYFAYRRYLMVLGYWKKGKNTTHAGRTALLFGFDI